MTATLTTEAVTSLPQLLARLGLTAHQAPRFLARNPELNNHVVRVAGRRVVVAAGVPAFEAAAAAERTRRTT